MTIERAEADTVAFSVEDGIAWVWFNRPEKRNCMSPKLNRRMKQVLEELEFRDDVKVLVLTGEGEAWTAGMDLKEMEERRGVPGDPESGVIEVLGRVERQRRPVPQAPAFPRAAPATPVHRAAPDAAGSRGTWRRRG